jgi:hypothetical protein
VAAAGEEDGVQGRVRGQTMEGRQALGVFPGEEAVAGARRQVVRRNGHEAQPFESGETARQALRVDGTGERRDPHPVAGADGRWKLGGSA